MKAKIQREAGSSDKVSIASLNQGDWFLDSDGCLCLRTDEERYAYVGDEDGEASGASLFVVDDELVTPVQVTISY